MLVLPRLLYHFSALPFLLLNKWFAEMRSFLTALIWGKSRACVAFSKLYVPLSEGGLGAPNFEYYFEAAQLQWVMRWLAGHNLHELGTTIKRGGTIGLLKWLLSPSADTPVADTNLLLRNAEKCWFRYIHRSDRITPYAPQLPLWVLLGLVPTQHRLATAAWEEVGILEWGDLFEDSMLTLLDELLNDFSLPPGYFLTHGALTWLAATYLGSLPSKPATSVLLQTILTHGNTNKAITNIYNALRIDDNTPLTSLQTY
ncbi:hypothetical protein NDU88_004399 [Pleurodeles waltl]|uniref:Uncharacterized protein n=1 Tax=Pleurodeles waltl TaxID=8319 RepID=A0AAV7UF13_PLEWA|nr:hypothetical protein NDU88_004399 [Pleurodeles waltl]